MGEFTSSSLWNFVFVTRSIKAMNNFLHRHDNSRISHIKYRRKQELSLVVNDPRAQEIKNCFKIILVNP